MVDWRKVALLALVALAAAVVGLAVLPSIGLVRFGSAVLGINAAFTPAILAADIASGLTLFAAGLIAWIRQPANPIWRLMIAAYFADYLWQLAFVPPPLLLLVGIVIVAGTLGLDAIVAAALSPPVWVVDFILPVAFLIGALRLRMARASIASAVLELGSLPTPARLQEILRRRVGDPSLLVLRWSQAQGVFVDDDGRPVEEAPAGSQQTLTVLERDGRKAAAVLHDSALADDAVLPQAIVAAAAMIMEATDIRDELRARGGQTDGLPSEDVTFVFADIEQSTALLDSLGPMYASVLGDLRRLASDIADQHGGRLVDAIGDELFLAFPVASAAVMGAVELTRRLARIRGQTMRSSACASASTPAGPS